MTSTLLGEFASKHQLITVAHSCCIRPSQHFSLFLGGRGGGGGLKRFSLFFDRVLAFANGEFHRLMDVCC